MLKKIIIVCAIFINAHCFGSEIFAISLQKGGKGALPKLNGASLQFYKEMPPFLDYRKRLEQLHKLGFSQEGANEIEKIVTIFRFAAEPSEQLNIETLVWKDYRDFMGQPLSDADIKVAENPATIKELKNMQEEIDAEHTWFDENMIKMDDLTMEETLYFPNQLAKYFHFWGYPANAGGKQFFRSGIIPIEPGYEHVITRASKNKGKYYCGTVALDEGDNVCVTTKKLEKPK